MMRNIIVKNNEFSDLNPIQFGFEDCEKSHFFGPAVRSYWLIHYVVSGCGIFRIEGTTHPVKAGQMFVIPPQVETFYQADEQTPWQYIWIGFTADPRLTKDLKPVLTCPEGERLFHQMKTCESLSAGRTPFLTAKLWELLVLLSETASTPDPDPIQKAVDCIHAEYMYDVSIEALAKRVNLERTYFSVLFKSRLGCSPKQYLLNHRMNTAAELLNRGGLSISVVARSVGYTDLYVFSKMFKRHFGVPPTHYKK